LAVGLTALTATLVAWLLATVRFLFPNALLQPPARLKVGFPHDYPSGRVETRFADRHGLWIVRGTIHGRSQIYALRAVCTHLGCTPIWQEGEQKFKCPCHGSGFTKEGLHFEGPAPRPLERYAIRVAEDGQLEVNKGRLFRQELGQWQDPASYVEV
jgi:cytochrome b6-f complex iron-sulfur subunit